MKKKLLIGFGILVLIIGLGMLYLNNRNRTLSPPGQEVYKKNDFEITVNYSRPSVKGRLMVQKPMELCNRMAVIGA